MKKLALSVLLCSMMVTANANDKSRNYHNQNPAYAKAITECKKTAGIPEKASRSEKKQTKDKPKITQTQRDTFNNCMKLKGFEKPQRKDKEQNTARKQAATECRTKAGITVKTPQNESQNKDRTKVTQIQKDSFDSCMNSKGFEPRQRKVK